MALMYNDLRVEGAVPLDANGNSPSANPWKYAAASGGVASSTADVVLKSGTAGVVNYLKSVQICHDALGAVTEFVIKNGSTVIYRGKLQTAASETGVSLAFDPPLKADAGAALNFALVTSVTGGVFVNAQGYSGA